MWNSKPVEGLSFCYIWITATELSSLHCYRQTRLAAGVTGKSRVGAKGQGKGSGVDPPGEDEGKRKGGEEESDMGGRDLEH